MRDAARKELTELALEMKHVEGKRWKIVQDRVKMGENWTSIANALECVLDRYGKYRRDGKSWLVEFNEEPNDRMVKSLMNQLQVSLEPFSVFVKEITIGNAIDVVEEPPSWEKGEAMKPRIALGGIIPEPIQVPEPSKGRDAKRPDARKQPEVEKGTVREVIERFPLMEPLNARREAAWKISHLIRSGDIDVMKLLEYAEKIVK